MKYLSLTIPRYGQIDSTLPAGVPTGGLATGQNIIRVGITLFVTLSILFALYLILQGGIDIIMSKGHKENLVRGREKVIFALLGLIFIFLVFLLAAAGSALFGTDLLCFVFRPLSSDCSL